MLILFLFSKTNSFQGAGMFDRKQKIPFKTYIAWPIKSTSAGAKNICRVRIVPK